MSVPRISNGLIKMALRNFRYRALSSEHAGIYFGCLVRDLPGLGQMQTGALFAVAEYRKF